jgi:hypothetical protein
MPGGIVISLHSSHSIQGGRKGRPYHDTDARTLMG